MATVTHSSTVTNSTASGTSVVLSSVNANVTDAVIIVKVAGKVNAGAVVSVSSAEVLDVFVEQGTRVLSSNSGSWLFICTAPVGSTNDITVSSTLNSRYVCSASVYSGADQATQPVAGSLTTASATSSTAATLDLAAATDDMNVDNVSHVAAGPGTATETFTQRHHDTGVGGGTDILGSGQEEAGDGTTKAMAYTLSVSGNWAMQGVEIKASAGTPPTGINIFRRRIEGY